MTFGVGISKRSTAEAGQGRSSCVLSRIQTPASNPIGIGSGAITRSLGKDGSHNFSNDASDYLADRRGFSNKHFDCLRFIIGFVETWGFSPSIRETMAALKLSSTSKVFARFARLQGRGYISKPLRNQPRAITIVRHVPVPRAPDGAPLYFVPFHNSTDSQRSQ